MWRLTTLVAACVLGIGGTAWAQTPEVVYSWSGTSRANWLLYDRTILEPILGPGYNKAAMSVVDGNLVVTETGVGSAVGMPIWILEGHNYARENYFAKGNHDVTGLDYLEIDLRHNSTTATVNVNLFLQAIETEDVVVNNGAPFPVAPGLNTLRFPLSLLTPRQQTSLKTYIIIPEAHAAVGNLTWTITEVRTVGTPLAYRDVVTNDLGSVDDGIDGAFPLKSDDMAAIVGNAGLVSQEGLTRNPAGSGSLQWTDRGGDGSTGSESGASIGWGNGNGWRNAQPGSPTAGNSYNQRISDFSNYDRMTVRIAARDAVNPAGAVGIESLFYLTEFDPPTVLPSQSLPTDGEYRDVVYDLSSVTYLKNIWHWGIDVAPHPNEIVFNVDNVRFWNSAALARLPGDYNGDGSVNGADLAAWSSQFAGPATGSPNADGNDDGDVDGLDLLVWQRQFGRSSASAQAVPEPGAALAALALAAAAASRRRRRLG